jgi:hypothetical protein
MTTRPLRRFGRFTSNQLIRSDAQYANTISEIIANHSSVNNKLYAYPTIPLETIATSDGVVFILSLQLSEVYTLTSSLLFKLIKLVEERIYISSVLDSQVEANSSLQELIDLLDSLINTYPAAIAENISVLQEILNKIYFYSGIEESQSVSDALEGYVDVALLLDEAIANSDTLTDTSILVEAIRNSLVFIQDLKLPDQDNYTGWVLNPENFAVSTYTNFNFNSFTKFNDEYYAASPTGLYRLEGSTDQGEYIISRIQTAAMQFGTSNLKNVSQCYLGVSQDSKIILKAAVDGKATAFYELKVSSNNLSTQRVKLGRGLIGRYFQFEIITKDNNELDLESIEFYPVVLSRKV